MDQARRAERELAAGRDCGPLHGIPYGAKDLLATSGGIPTSWGAAPLKDQRFDEDATVIRKLEAAGAVLCAKLAMVELAGGMGYRQPHASFTGPGINPWNRDAWSGGSSSGSGSAVSAGLVPFAIGSETWGSILGPAGYLRHRRSPAELRPRQPPRRHGAVLDARQAGPDRPHRGRLRPRARRHRGTRRGRSHHDGAAVSLRGRGRRAPALSLRRARERDGGVRRGRARQFRGLARRAAPDRHRRGGPICRTCPGRSSRAPSCTSRRRAPSRS